MVAMSASEDANVKPIREHTGRGPRKSRQTNKNLAAVGAAAGSQD